MSDVFVASSPSSYGATGIARAELGPVSTGLLLEQVGPGTPDLDVHAPHADFVTAPLDFNEVAKVMIYAGLVHNGVPETEARDHASADMLYVVTGNEDDPLQPQPDVHAEALARPISRGTDAIHHGIWLAFLGDNVQDYITDRRPSSVQQPTADGRRYDILASYYEQLNDDTAEDVARAAYFRDPTGYELQVSVGRRGPTKPLLNFQQKVSNPEGARTVQVAPFMEYDETANTLMVAVSADVAITRNKGVSAEKQREIGNTPMLAIRQMALTTSVLLVNS